MRNQVLLLFFFPQIQTEANAHVTQSNKPYKQEN